MMRSILCAAVAANHFFVPHAPISRVPVVVAPAPAVLGAPVPAVPLQAWPSAASTTGRWSYALAAGALVGGALAVSGRAGPAVMLFGGNKATPKKAAPKRVVKKVAPKKPVKKVAPKKPVKKVAPKRVVKKVAPKRVVRKVAPKAGGKADQVQDNGVLAQLVPILVGFLNSPNKDKGNTRGRGRR